MINRILQKQFPHANQIHFIKKQTSSQSIFILPLSAGVTRKYWPLVRRPPFWTGYTSTTYGPVHGLPLRTPSTDHLPKYNKKINKE